MIKRFGEEPLRDRAYLDYLRQSRCIITGQSPCDPMHIGTAGRGVKSGDDQALPVAHHIHAEAHAKGEISTLRRLLPDTILRTALRAYARELYREWQDAKQSGI